jgi:phenylalanyl-tRNA synthetase beta chain
MLFYKKGKIRGQRNRGMICAEMNWVLRKSWRIIILDDSLPGTTAAQVFKIENDEVFEIGLTPNRADAMSHLGTRDLRAGLPKCLNVELIHLQ